MNEISASMIQTKYKYGVQQMILKYKDQMEGKEGNPNNEVSLDDDLETFRQTDKVTNS